MDAGKMEPTQFVQKVKGIEKGTMNAWRVNWGILSNNLKSKSMVQLVQTSYVHGISQVFYC